VAELLRGTLAAGNTGMALPALAPLGIRGAISEPLVYQAEELQIVVDREEAASGQPDLYDLLILITGQINPIQTIQLTQGDTILAELEVDSLGNAVLSDVANGEYILRIRDTEREVVIQGIILGGSSKP
jgi:hypothetical protein